MSVQPALDLAPALGNPPPPDAHQEEQEALDDTDDAPVGGEVLPGAETWEHFIHSHTFETHAVGRALMESYAATPWEQVFRPFVEAAGTPNPVSAAHKAALIGKYASAPSMTYLLTVVDDKVEVVYGIKPCYVPSVSVNGDRYLALMGERRVWSGIMIPPKLVTLEGAIAIQATPSPRSRCP